MATVETGPGRHPGWFGYANGDTFGQVKDAPIGFGHMKRKEDARFIRGQGTYLDDIELPLTAVLADMEDASTPHWSNVVGGQATLYDAVRRQLSFSSPEGKEYALTDPDRLPGHRELDRPPPGLVQADRPLGHRRRRPPEPHPHRRAAWLADRGSLRPQPATRLAPFRPRSGPARYRAPPLVRRRGLRRPRRPAGRGARGGSCR